VLRILDANLNRATEAARVIEEYCRFVLDDAALAQSLKELRHEIRRALDAVAPPERRLARRDTPGDVGTRLSLPSEQARADAPAVVAASFRRLSEALRCLEEYAKPLSAEVSAELEKMRYRAYDLEVRLARTFPCARWRKVALYVIVTGSVAGRDALQVVRAAAAGGADAIQLREKEMPDGQLVETARAAVQTAHDHGALLIVNDRADVAYVSGADGVHLGPGDVAPADARSLLGPGFIIGASTHSVEEALSAEAAGADYIAVGSIFATSTKPERQPVGVELVRKVLDNVHAPVAAIGGIDVSNAGAVLATGCGCVCVCSAIISRDDIEQATRQFKQVLQEHRKQDEA